MKCKQVQERIWDYLARELPADEQEAVSAHLQGCPACRQEVHSAQMMVVSLRNLPRYRASDLLKARIRERIRQERVRVPALPRGSWRRWALVPVVGVLSALVVLGGLNLWRGSQEDALSSAYAQACIELHEQMEVVDWAPSPAVTYASYTR